MVVDDEQLTVDHIKKVVPKLHPDWEVTMIAENGYEAYELFKSGNVNLILTDINMPVMNGLELCQKIKEINPNQKMIILSGYNEFHLAQEAMKYGVKHFLLKPLVTDDLYLALDNIASEIDTEEKKYPHSNPCSIIQRNQSTMSFVIF